MRPESETDRDLVQRFLARREEALFRKLYDRHTPAVYRCVVRILRCSPGEAEDVVQDTWVRAIRALEEFRWQSSMRTWLTGIALNCAREVRRGVEHDGEAALESMAEEEPEPAPFADVTTRELEQAIAGLATRYREVLVLHDIEGHTHAEVASLLGVTPGTSKSQLARARRALRSRLNTLDGVRNQAVTRNDT